MRRVLSLLALAVACGCLALVGSLSSCTRSPTAPAGNPAGGVTIDPNGDTDFFLGSVVIDGTTNQYIDVWGQNLRVVHRAQIVFDVVLVNRSKEPVYPLVFFYITRPVPSSVEVTNYDMRGFGDSFVFELSYNLGEDGRLDPGEASRPRAIGFHVPEIMSFAIGFRIRAGAPPVAVDCPEPYPKVFEALPSETLAELKAEFAALNPNICSGLNQYGFTVGFCHTFPNPLPDSVDVEPLIEDAKGTLADNFRFTGVADASTLVAGSHVLYNGQLHIYFGWQKYAGLEVVHSTIRVHVDAVGVRTIHGNHYPEICVPRQPILPPVPAQESIIGLGIPWYDFGGGLNIHYVTEEDLDEPPTKVILPYESFGSMQLRVAWRIPVGMGYMQRAWYVYVDTMDREVLWIEQLFYT